MWSHLNDQGKLTQLQLLHSYTHCHRFVTFNISSIDDERSFPISENSWAPYLHDFLVIFVCILVSRSIFFILMLGFQSHDDISPIQNTRRRPAVNVNRQSALKVVCSKYIESHLLGGKCHVVHKCVVLTLQHKEIITWSRCGRTSTFDCISRCLFSVYFSSKQIDRHVISTPAQRSLH